MLPFHHRAETSVLASCLSFTVFQQFVICLKYVPQGVYDHLTICSEEENYQSISFCCLGNPCLWIIACWNPFFFYKLTQSVEQSHQAFFFLPLCSSRGGGCTWGPPPDWKSLSLLWLVGMNPSMFLIMHRRIKRATYVRDYANGTSYGRIIWN